MTWKVYIRDANRRRTVQLRGWQSLTLLQRRNDVGTWLLKYPPNADFSLVQPGTGVIIRRDDITIASGWMWTPRERRELGIERDGTVGGWDDNAIIDDALCWPQPTLPIGSQTDTPFSTAVNTPAANRVRQLFDVNVIQRQQIPGAAVEAASGLGKLGRSKVMMTPLLEHAREICARDVNFWVRQRDSDRALVLQFRVPRDLRQTTSFSPQRGTVSQWSATDSGPEVQEIILGAGEPGNRVFRRRTASDAGLVGSRVQDWGGVRKIERYIDGSGLDPVDPLFVDQANERMESDLIDGRRKQSFHVEVEGRLPFRAPISQGGFDVGDLGRAWATPTERVDDLIEQVQIDVTADGGERTQVWVGPVNDPDERDADRERRLRQQVNRLMRAS